MRSLGRLSVTIRLLVFVTVIGALLAITISAIQRPIAGETRSFEGIFTDASGLREGSDVRMLGVGVGKVTRIELVDNEAHVSFSVVTDREMDRGTALAIRYQNLTGQRYLDIQRPVDNGGDPLPAGATIGAEHTTPSFDITSLFNGMQPVLAELEPADVNAFLENALAVVEGDGKAVGKTLDAIAKLSEYVDDRQGLITALVGNLQRVSDQLGGKSPETITLIQGISDVFINLQKQVGGLMDFANTAPAVLGPLNSLLASLGFTEPTNPDLDHLLHSMFPNPDDAVELLRKLPGLLHSMTQLVPEGSAQPAPTCSHGSAEVPGPLEVLFAGQKVTICNQ